MKMLCISKKLPPREKRGFDSRFYLERYSQITVGKEYEIDYDYVVPNEDVIGVKNDLGLIRVYHKFNFKKLDEE